MTTLCGQCDVPAVVSGEQLTLLDLVDRRRKKRRKKKKKKGGGGGGGLGSRQVN